MTDDEARGVERLTREYVDAHFARIAQQDRPRLWADRPVAGEYRGVLAAVRAAALLPPHSDLFIEGYVDDLLQAALDEPAAIAAHVLTLRGVLEHAVTTRLYVPIDGLSIDQDEVRLGAVRLVRMDDVAFERLVVAPFAEIMRRNPHYDDDRADEIVETHRTRLQSLRGRTCVEIRTELDLTLSFERAESIVGDVCDFLQLCLAPSVRRQPGNPVRWSTGIVQAWKMSFGESDGPQPRSNSNAELEFGGPPAELGVEELERLRASGLLELGDELGAPPTSEYRALLRRAVRWFAKGERERHPDDRKLAYVTAIDLFFARPPRASRDGRGVVQRFCEGVGFALEESVDGVERAARSVYGFYTSRSETSHAGHVDLESDESVDQFRWTVLNFLANMAERPFTTKDDIESWIAERRAALSPEDLERVNEASRARVVEQDHALSRAIAHFSIQAPVSQDLARERYVFSRLLADAVRAPQWHAQLRPLAAMLESALNAAAENEDYSVAPALHVLAGLSWVADGLAERIAALAPRSQTEPPL